MEVAQKLNIIKEQQRKEQGYKNVNGWQSRTQNLLLDNFNICWLQRNYNYKHKSWKQMLIQPRSKSQNLLFGEQTTFSNNLTQLINSFASKNYQKIFTFLELDSTLGFKIELKFSMNQMSISGILQYYNGSPLSIPEIYQSLLIEKAEREISKILTFQFVRQSGVLSFQSGIKLDSHCHDPLQLVSNHLRLSIDQTPKICDILTQFGLVKKKNLNYLKIKSKRLALLTKIAQTLSNQEQPKQVFLMKSHKSSVFKKVKKIEEIQLNIEDMDCQESNNTQILKKGGYFEVEKKPCEIVLSENSDCFVQKSVVPLAVKKLRKSQESNINSQNKILKQLKILNQITDPTFNINYWIQQKNEPTQSNLSGIDKFDLSNGKLFMDFVEESLDDYIYGQNLSASQIIDFSKQIVSAVGVLSECGIVHRDLKPDNLLVKTSENEDGSLSKHLKIIDFGQSSLITDSFNKQKDLLGSTIPYSPIQCYVSSSEGFNSSSIDRWSVGLIIYELVFKRNPISYSRCFAADIYKGWKIPEEFYLFPNIIKKSGCEIIEYVFSLLTIKSVCIDQKERLSLYKMKQMMGHIEGFISEMKL